MSLTLRSLCVITLIQLTLRQQVTSIPVTLTGDLTNVCSAGQAERILSAVNQLQTAVSRLETTVTRLRSDLAQLNASGAGTLRLKTRKMKAGVNKSRVIR